MVEMPMGSQGGNMHELSSGGWGLALPRLILLSVLAVGCGFGTYNDTSDPRITSSNSGVPDAGQWWPFACVTGSPPTVPASVPIGYSTSGTCGDGGTFALSVDGCLMVGDWTVLGLTDVTTNVPSSIPAAGGWEVAGTGGFDVGDGGTQWTCDSSADSSGALTFTCSAGVPPVQACESTLTPVSGT
jgi:hypothetical protein